MTKKKKEAYRLAEVVLKENTHQWLPAREITVKVNDKLPNRQSTMTRTIQHWLKVLNARNKIEKRMEGRDRLYRWRT